MIERESGRQMNDKDKSKRQLIGALSELRQQVAALEKVNADLHVTMRRLERAEATYRRVADNSPGWEFWLSPESDFVYSSPSSETITGYGSSEFLSDPYLFFRIIHPDDLPRVAEHLSRVKIDRGFCELEFRIIHRSGLVRRISSTVLGMHDAEGNYLGIRGSIRIFPLPDGSRQVREDPVKIPYAEAGNERVAVR